MDENYLKSVYRFLEEKYKEYLLAKSLLKVPLKIA